MMQAKSDDGRIYPRATKTGGSGQTGLSPRLAVKFPDADLGYTTLEAVGGGFLAEPACPMAFRGRRTVRAPHIDA